MTRYDHAFIFDLDGVVIDSMPLHTEAWKIYLDRLGRSSEGIEEGMHGRRNDEIVEAFIGRDLAPEVLFEHGAAKERLFREMMREQLREKLVPGVVEFVKSLRGEKIGLASNAEPANIEFVLEGAGLRDAFQVIVDGGQVARPKPYPDIYLRAAQLLACEPARCIIFEDSPTGVAAAVASGARVAGVRTHPVELRGVEIVIRDFLDPRLKEWIETARHLTTQRNGATSDSASGL